MSRPLTCAIGSKFGRWTVVSLPTGGDVFCVCECGPTRYKRKLGHIICGRTRSCGCFRRDVMSRRPGHRMSGTRLYWVWAQMRERCGNPKSIGYENYGGRGIRVCDEWNDASVFLEWAASGWKPGLTLDRKDTNGNYEPDNCTWSSRKEQCRNQRRTVMCFYGGRRISVMEAAELSGLHYRKIIALRRRGWPEDQWFR